MNAFSTGSMADNLLRWSKQLEALGGAITSMAASTADDVSFELYGEDMGLIIIQYANAIHDTVEENYAVMVRMEQCIEAATSCEETGN